MISANRLLLVLGLLGVVAPPALAADAPSPRAEFTRLIAHWSDYGDDNYLKFVEDARPEVCQIGFYGGHFYSLAHTPQYKGYPAHFPVQGLAECGKWFEERNAAIHKLGAKVVGHFNVTFLVGEPESPEGPRGFFKFYRELWDEKELGKKPVEDPLELVARNADGSPMASKQYSIGKMREFTACLNNPHWRAVLKAWAKRGIERGVDGFIANYFYRHNCLCQHCQTSFRAYLAERFTPAQLRERFEIADVATHGFSEIVGWHKPAESTPLRREMLRWSQICCKQAFDEVFVKHARAIKPGLLVAQWNHLSDFSQISGDERCMLPAELWGRDEDYLWYSTGAAACFTDLAEGYLGEGTLQARYIRGAFDDKPFTLGKYESTRTRVAIAELAANGGAPMGFYTRFKDPMAGEEIARYYRFMEKNDAVYRANRSHAEVLLLYPRSRVHGAADVAAVDEFKKTGKALLDRHVLFDVLPDDIATADRRAGYRMTIDPATSLAGASSSSGASVPSDPKAGSETRGNSDPVGSAALNLPQGVSTFNAPTTVRISSSTPGRSGGKLTEITLHFVNYNREEPAKKRSAGMGIKDEKPIAVESVEVDLVLPEGARVKAVRVSSPESPEAIEVKHVVTAGRLRFTAPKFLVYAIARVELGS